MNFCTFFDLNYLNKGLVCYHTLHNNDPEAILYVLCMDEVVFNNIEQLPNIRPILLKAIEQYYPPVLEAKKNRDKKEYALTMKPLLPLYIFDTYELDTLFYIDADMAFWSNPQELLDVFKNSNILVCDHELRPVYPAGRFNAGFIGYKNNCSCRKFLEWWRDRCIEWCRWFTLEPEKKCGDQAYLGVLHNSSVFSGVLSNPHPGINLAPWNIGKHVVTSNNGKLLVDGIYNLICYHYHEFKLISNSYYSTGWKHTPNDELLLYVPYFILIKKYAEGR